MPLMVTLSMPWHVTNVDLLAMALRSFFVIACVIYGLFPCVVASCFCTCFACLHAILLLSAMEASIWSHCHLCPHLNFILLKLLPEILYPEESPAWVMAVLSTCYHSQLSALKSQLMNGGGSIPGFVLFCFFFWVRIIPECKCLASDRECLSLLLAIGTTGSKKVFSWLDSDIIMY